jgi:hypothetical protein
MRRLVTLALAVTMVVAVASPALADDLSDRLARAEQAEFAGELFVSCSTPDGVVSQLLDVVRSGGVLWVRTPDAEVVAADGTVVERGPDGRLTGVRVTSTGTWQMAERYEVDSVGTSVALGRLVDVVVIRDGALDRVTLEFDAETGALLRSEVRNGDGSRYCTSAYVTFAPGRVAVGPPGLDQVEPEEIVPLDPTAVDPRTLPLELAEFRRVDVYTSDKDLTVAYYSDGVFSFTLLASTRPIRISELADKPPVEVDGFRYVRHFRPGEVVYSWESRFGGYALVGDLPLDLQEAVLAELPRPGRVGFFQRLWRSLFG